MIITVSSIHGFSHVANNRYHPLERLLWLAIVIGAAYLTMSLCNISLKRYQDNPTVISIERSQNGWNISFPAVTFCPFQKVDYYLLDEYLNSTNSSHIENKKQFRRFVETLLNSTYENVGKIEGYGNYMEGDLISLIDKFRFKLKAQVSNKLILQPSLTELGICYSYNSKLAVYNSLE